MYLNSIKYIFIIVFLQLPPFLSAQEFDFTREYDFAPVSYDGVECQVPWTTGYNYINPTFCDIDGDNDFDLLFGSDLGRLTFLINDGTPELPDFDFVTDTFTILINTIHGIERPVNPTFCDIDNDGDFDLFIGAYSGYPVSQGKLFFFENTGNNLEYNYVLSEEFFQSLEIQTNPHPAFVDIDADGDFDLFLGLLEPWTTIGGRIMYFENIGTAENPDMSLVTDYFMEIDLGYAAFPTFCDIDDDGDFDLFIGEDNHSINDNGRIHFYRNDGTSQNFNFTYVTEFYQGIGVGYQASPEFVDLDNDTDLDLFVGERSLGATSYTDNGDIHYYLNIGNIASAEFELITQNFVTLDVSSMSGPAFADIDNDGKTDMFIGTSSGQINYFRNIGATGEPAFELETLEFQRIYFSLNDLRPDFSDFDYDGDLDMCVSRSCGIVCFYQNMGTAQEPMMQELTRLFHNYEFQFFDNRLTCRFEDIDRDSDIDLFMGHSDNQLAFFENIGTLEEIYFTRTDENFLNTPVVNGSAVPITFGDLDYDGDMDLIRGRESHYLDFYRNVGNIFEPSFVLDQSNFLDIYMPKDAIPYLEDIDQDGDLDLFVGNYEGGISFWRNNEIENGACSIANSGVNIPKTMSLLPSYPNPFNQQTVISYQLTVEGYVELAVHDITGRLVESLVTGHSSPGKYNVLWNAGGLASGVYLVRLDAGNNFSQTNKMILVK